MNSPERTSPTWPITDTVGPPHSAGDKPRQKDPFIKGPICLRWVSRAVRLRKPALAAGLVLWFLRGVSYSSGPFKITRRVRNKFQLSGPQMLRGLRALETAKLVRFIKRGRGRCAVVEIIDLTPYKPRRPPATRRHGQEIDLRDNITAL
jgi:hypothetical protein